MTCQTPRALALGATIAFGSCHLAACEHLEEPAVGAPLTTTTQHHDQEPEVEEPPTELDLGADRGQLGDIELSPGFTPDPTTWSGTTTGGPIDLTTVDDRCSGWVGPAPDVTLRTTRPFAELVVMAASPSDTTIALAGPDGELRCGDDEDGEHPIVRGYFEPGTFRIWVGAAAQDATAPFVLAVSELDDSLPSSLPH